MRVLLVEDEAPLAILVSEALQREGFEVDGASSIKAAEYQIEMIHYDIMLLDRNLPDGDGLSLIQRALSLNKTIPALVLTARTHLDDRVQGLESGADDYLVKPFEVPELLARVKTILRRPLGPMGMILEIGNVSLNTASGDLTINGMECRFVRRERMILEILLRRAGRLVNKDHLEQSMYGSNDEGSRGAVDIAVHRLRKSLLRNGATIQIHTMRGLGYVLEGSKS